MKQRTKQKKPADDKFSFQRHQPKRLSPTEWPPAWARLPSIDVLEQISRGEGPKRQRQLFGEGRDQTRAGRVKRL